MKLTASLFVIAALTGSASAAVIYDFDYDGKNPSTTAGGSAPNKSYSITADGVGGSGGGNATFDSTGGSGSFTFSQDLSNGRNGVLATSLNASDYILSFDVKAIGLLSGQSISGQAQLTFNFSSQRQANGISITDTFQSYSLNLGSDFTSSPAFTLANMNNNMQFKITDFSSHARFGYDSGNSIIYDNVKLTQVPEPSSMAALSLAVGAAMLRRRRA